MLCVCVCEVVIYIALPWGNSVQQRGGTVKTFYFTYKLMLVGIPAEALIIAVKKEIFIPGSS